MIYNNGFDDVLKLIINSRNLLKIQVQIFESHEPYIQNLIHDDS